MFFLSFQEHSPPHAHRQAAVFLEKWHLSQATMGLASVSPKTQHSGDMLFSRVVDLWPLPTPNPTRSTRPFLPPPFSPRGGRILATGIFHPCSLQAVLLGFPPPVGKEANKASYEMTVHSPEERRAGLHGDATIYTCVNQSLSCLCRLKKAVVTQMPHSIGDALE